MADENGNSGGVWYRIRKMVSNCAASTDLEDLKASVELAKERVDKALMAGTILQGNSGAFEKLTKANEGLGAVGESLGMVQDICLDMDAVGKIHDAIVVLSDDRVIEKNPQAAADAFDSLFNGIGRLCRHLPPPADEWGEFFSQFNLFGNMQRKVFAPYFQRAWNAGVIR
jgi:hypothetical protein